MITLEQVKADLRVTHDEDDGLLEILLNGATDEALLYMNRAQLPTVDDVVVGSVYTAVFLLVRGMYDTTDPAQMTAIRQRAEVMLQPYRQDLGL